MSVTMLSNVDRHEGRNPVATLHIVQLVVVWTVNGAVLAGSVRDNPMTPPTSKQLNAPPVPPAARQLMKFDGVVSSWRRFTVQSVIGGCWNRCARYCPQLGLNDGDGAVGEAVGTDIPHSQSTLGVGEPACSAVVVVTFLAAGWLMGQVKQDLLSSVPIIGPFDHTRR
jgi:hypothetical protein